MKYVKPEILVVKVETQPIASSGMDGWLTGTDYAGAENHVTDFLVNS